MNSLGVDELQDLKWLERECIPHSHETLKEYNMENKNLQQFLSDAIQHEIYWILFKKKNQKRKIAVSVVLASRDCRQSERAKGLVLQYSELVCPI